MTNGNVAAEGKNPQSLKRKILKKVVLCVAVYIGFLLVMGLPSVVKVAVLTAVLVLYFYPLIAAGIQRAKNSAPGVKRTVTRISRVASALSGMSDEEFESKFCAARHQTNNDELNSPESAHFSVQQTTTGFIPNFLCKSIMTEETAYAAALAWWEEESKNEMTGAQRVSEVITEISYKDPTKHTCVLSDFSEVCLPTEVPVLRALATVMKADGLDADFNDDGKLIVCWNQYADGTEAAQAHADTSEDLTI